MAYRIESFQVYRDTSRGNGWYYARSCVTRIIERGLVTELGGEVNLEFILNGPGMGKAKKKLESQLAGKGVKGPAINDFEPSFEDLG